MSEKASFVHVEPDGRFQFHAADGSEVAVTADKPFETRDEGLVAWLDQSPFVKRASKSASGKEG